MNKTITINLNGIIFHLEENAFSVLDDFVESIKEHVPTSEKQKQTMIKIESKIAEVLSKKINESKQVLLVSDIESMIKEVGSFENFIEKKLPNHENEKNHEHNSKRLFRSSDDIILGGVSSGIATYLGTDPAFIRLLFLFSLLFNGFGLMAYMILWIILPQAKTLSEKQRMQAHSNFFSEIKKNLKNNFSSKDSLENRILTFFNNTLKKIIKVFQSLEPTLKKVISITSKILGTLLVIGSSLAIGSVTFLLSLLLFKPDIFYSSNIQLFGAQHYVFTFSVFAAIFIPFYILLSIGISLLKRKIIFGMRSLTISLLIWFLSLILLIFTFVVAFPEIKEDYLNNSNSHSKQFIF